MNTLWILGIGEFFSSIIAGLFRWVAQCYDLILNISNDMNLSTEAFSTLYERLYLLVGVFMLFRIAISLLVMLINPDKVSDKKSGATNLFMRIITSLILLIVTPFLFEFVAKVQVDLLANDPNNDNVGLIYNIFSLQNDYQGSTETLKSLEVLTETVKADDKKTCYYFSVSNPNYNFQTKEYTEEMVAGAFALEFYKKDKNGSCGNGVEIKDLDTSQMTPGGSAVGTSTNWCVSSKSGITSDGKIKFTKVNFDDVAYIWDDGMNSYDITDPNSPCPSQFEALNCQGYDNTGKPTELVCRTPSQTYPYTYNGMETSYFSIYLDESSSSNYITDATSSYSEFLDIYRENAGKIKETASSLALDKWFNYKEVSKEAGIKDGCEFFTAENGQLGASISGMNFANNAARTIIDLRGKDNEEYKGFTYANLLDCYMFGTEADRMLGELYDEDEIYINLIMGIIVPIALIIVLFSIAISVAIRNFKLFFLQIIAPIPILCRINPDDKVFDTWLKQFTSCYIELFLYVLAVNAGIFLLDGVMEQSFASLSGVAKIVVMLGAVLFIKTVPSFLSKIFGLSDAGGTLKDSFKLVKTGLGIGVGAAVGGLIGAGGAISAFRATKGQSNRQRFLGTAGALAGGALGGIVAGGLSGRNGKIPDAARKAARASHRSNIKRSTAYRNGVTPTQYWFGSPVASMGLDYKSRADKEIKKREGNKKVYDNFIAYGKDIEDAAVGTKLYTSFNSAAENGKLGFIADQSLREQFRDNIAQQQYVAYTANKDYLNSDQIDGLFAKTYLSKERIQKAIDNGDMTSAQEIVNRRKQIFDSAGYVGYNYDFSSNESSFVGSEGVKVEGGKASRIAGNVRGAKALANDESYRELFQNIEVINNQGEVETSSINISSLNDAASVLKAQSTVKGGASRISEQNKEVQQSAEYMQADYLRKIKDKK